MEKDKLIQLLEDAYRAGEQRGLHKYNFGYNMYDFIKRSVKPTNL